MRFLLQAVKNYRITLREKTVNSSRSCDSQRQIANDGMKKATTALSIPSLEPLESRQLDLTAFDLVVPLADVAVTSLHWSPHQEIAYPYSF